jgi:2-keto-4-pentenoate hydratase
MISPEATTAIAAELAAAERAAAPIAPLVERWPAITTDDAYRVQLVNVARRLAGGERLVGAKVGLTSQVMQRQLGVDEPDFGHLFASMLHEGDAALDTSRYCAPRVEVELAFVLGAPLRGPGCRVEDVLAATERVVPAIEVIDSRIEGWRITLADTVADNASSAAVVLGGPGVAVGAVDLTTVGARIRVGGVTVAEGRADAVLGDPARAVAWVADKWHELGRELAAGWVVMPGSCTAAVAVSAGDVVVAELDGLGSASVTFR